VNQATNLISAEVGWSNTKPGWEVLIPVVAASSLGSTDTSGRPESEGGGVGTDQVGNVSMDC